MKEKVLVVGGDSKISKVLIPYLKKEKFSVISTTRRKKNVSRSKIFLDLLKINKFIFPKNVSLAIVLAGVDGHKKCYEDSQYARYVNCVCVPNFVKKLIKKNFFVCIVSSSAVFISKLAFIKGESKYSPGDNYGIQKAIGEKKILNIARKQRKKHMISIARVTKNVQKKTSPFPDWIKKIKNNNFFFAFKDLYFAPITFVDTAKFLLKIIKNRYSGVYHFSGERDISYYDFAKRLLKYNNLDPNLVTLSYSHVLKKKWINNNRLTALSMKKTSKKIKVKPVKILKIIKLISSGIN